MSLPVYKTPGHQELRRFGLALGAALLALFEALPLLRHRPVHQWPWLAGGGLLALGLLAPRSLALVHHGWTRLGQALGWINLRIILTAIFFLLLMPIGLVRRLLGLSELDRASREGSYRKTSTVPARDQMEHPY